MSATDLAALVVVSLTYLASLALILGQLLRSVRRVERAVIHLEDYYYGEQYTAQHQHTTQQPEPKEGNIYGQVGGT